jgi:uncharacterized protein (UPF0276 family)
LRTGFRVQEFLGRELLVENVSSYFAFPEATIPEYEFVAAVAARTGCRLLIDVNNIYVNARNHGIDPLAYWTAIAPSSVAEILLAGFDATGRWSSIPTVRRSRRKCGRCSKPRWRASDACRR